MFAFGGWGLVFLCSLVVWGLVFVFPPWRYAGFPTLVVLLGGGGPYIKDGSGWRSILGFLLFRKLPSGKFLSLGDTGWILKILHDPKYLIPWEEW